MSTIRSRRARSFVMLLCATLAPACTSPAPSSTPPEYVTVGIGASPSTFDPRVATDDGAQRVFQLVYSPLMAMDDELRVVPGLAARLEHPDPLTYVAYLKSGVRFHDGHELTATDVVYTFRSFLDPAFSSPRKGAYRLVESVTARDAHTVVFTLTEPSPSFPTQLVMPIVSADAGDSLRTFPVGTGPYRFVGYADNEYVLLSAFEGYWDGLPQNAGLVLKVIPDERMRGRGLRDGTVDVIVNDLSSEAARELEREGFRILEAPRVDETYANDAPDSHRPGMTNIAVMRPGITGLRLGPRADLLSLKDVRKAGGPAGQFSS